MSTDPIDIERDRAEKISLYERGPLDLLMAWKSVPEGAQHFRPSPDSWSAHEIVCHCADAETIGATRIRLLVAEQHPSIAGYDQDEWVEAFSYENLKVETALAVVSAVRRWTVPVLKQISDAKWQATGKHSESGTYSASDWLETYSVHLRDHAEQIRSNVLAYESQHQQES